MQYLEALFLGVLQGLTEFIPVSSSGHLLIAEKVLNIDLGGLFFDVMLHIGTLLALVLYFRRDLLELAVAMFSRSKNWLWLHILVATVPAILAGMWLQPLAEGRFRSLPLVLFNLIWVSILMLAVDRVDASRDLTKMTPGKALLIGTFQALALIPGVSRSGITIIAARSQRFTRPAAARFAFLLAIPVTLGAIIKLLVSDGVSITSNLGVFVTGIVAAAVSGYLAIAWLLKYLSSHKLAPFAYYRLGLALLVSVVAIVI